MIFLMFLPAALVITIVICLIMSVVTFLISYIIKLHVLCRNTFFSCCSWCNSWEWWI